MCPFPAQDGTAILSDRRDGAGPTCTSSATRCDGGPKRCVYLRLVQAYRDDEGHVRHRVLKTLGREDELKASGQLEQLAGSFARLDPPLAGTRREVGPLLLAWHFMRELDLVATIDAVLPQRGPFKLAARAIERFGLDAARLHVDLITVRVAGAYEDSALIAKGSGAAPSGGPPGAHAAGRNG